MTPAPRRGARPRTADRSVARLRGLSITVLTMSLTLAAHASAGGAVPSPSGILLLLLAGAAAGVVAGPAVGPCGHRCGRAVVFGALLVGQGAGHLLLNLAGGAHHGATPHAGHPAVHHPVMHHTAAVPSQDTLPAHLLQAATGHGGPGMLAAHVAATLACAALLIVAEGLYGPLTTAFRRLVPAPPSIPAVLARPAPAPADEPDPRAASVPLTPLTRRGPPRSLPVRPGMTPAPA